MFKIMDIGKSIEKAIKVINSCKTLEQLQVAEKYVELLRKKIDNVIKSKTKC